jgi:hypothetical protein
MLGGEAVLLALTRQVRHSRSRAQLSADTDLQFPGSKFPGDRSRCPVVQVGDSRRSPVPRFQDS